jgi:hypothetical protein
VRASACHSDPPSVLLLDLVQWKRKLSDKLSRQVEVILLDDFLITCHTHEGSNGFVRNTSLHQCGVIERKLVAVSLRVSKRAWTCYK